MNYSRIYREFIADRRNAIPSGYAERHHVVPRSLGGGDGTENIVVLTAEDHYFAHLLLAKMHGGKMAWALQLLAETAGRRWSNRHSGRRNYGFGQRLAARLKGEAWQAEANPLHNPTIYEWAHYRSGERASATLYDMHKKFGATRGMWTAVATGARTSIRGWLLASKIDGHSHSEKGQAFEFINRDGRSFQGTQGEFASAHGINLASASRVIRHQSVTRCGWRRKGVMDRPANFAKDGLPAHQRR